MDELNKYENKKRYFDKEKFGIKIDCQVCLNSKREKWYAVYDKLIRKLFNKRDDDYKNFGAKGYIICEEWKIASNFKNFYLTHNPNQNLMIHFDMRNTNIVSPNNTYFKTKGEIMSIINTGSVGNKNDMEYYEIHPTTRQGFWTKCHRENLDIDDYIQVFSGYNASQEKTYLYYEYNKYKDDVSKVRHYRNKIRFSDFGFENDCQCVFLNDKGVYQEYKWYKTWKNIINRCYNPNNKSYKYYGMKGIYVSDEWKKSSVFRDFYIKNNPNDDLELDKDLLRKGYYGENSCVFLSKKENISLQIEQKRDKNIMMRLASINQSDSVNSITGHSFSIFVQGCSMNCLGCQNPQTHSYQGGFLLSLYDIQSSILESKSNSVSFLGGCPFNKVEREKTIYLIKWIKKNTNKFIYVWTGYLKEEVEQWIDLELIDILIDGKFELDKRNLNLLLRGSSNQRLFYKGKQVTEKELLEIVDNI